MKVAFGLILLLVSLMVVADAHGKGKNKNKKLGGCGAECQTECGAIITCKKQCKVTCAGAAAKRPCIRNCKLNTCMQNTECETCKTACFGRMVQCRTANCAEECPLTLRKPKKNKRCKTCLVANCRSSETE
uniref:Vanadium-binding protein 5 n=1 Tax=Ciona intestinalis TaxID=7719 RepID=A7VMV0_CIOIN|nr:vanadium-binding protein 5 precursor [Ciona intestinalis]BAF76320.1 vanadium-binding protein 5 [Ciona intestinalis]|eukprot:NP_001122356.1 vanadium-binding protein 5 precursor [Ciona intestinalis]